MLKGQKKEEDWELYKTASYVVTSEFIQDELPSLKFLQEGDVLLQKMWEEPFPVGHPYLGRLYIVGPKGVKHYQLGLPLTPTKLHFHDHILPQMMMSSYQEK